MIPEKVENYKFGNNFIGLTLYLALEEDIREACLSAKKKMNFMKNSLLPAGFYLLIMFYTTFMPHLFVNSIYQSSGCKHTILLSNVPGYIKPVRYGGQVARRFYSLISGPSSLATSISIVSMLESA